MRGRACLTGRAGCACGRSLLASGKGSVYLENEQIGRIASTMARLLDRVIFKIGMNFKSLVDMLSAIKTNRVVIHKHIKPTMKKIFFLFLRKNKREKI